MIISRRPVEDSEPARHERHGPRTVFPQRGLLQPCTPDGTWRYVGVTALKAAVATGVAVAIWPYVPAWDAVFEGADRTARKWSFFLWMMFVLFVFGGVWGSLKALQGAWMARR